MKHFVYLAILLALTVFTVFGQDLPKVEPCTLPIEKLPKIHGLSLGMSFSEVKAKYPNLITKPADENGFQVAIAKDITSREFSDIQIITFSFLDTELQGLDIEYKSGTKFPSVSALSRKFSTLLLAPNKSWVNVSMGGVKVSVEEGGGYAIAKCYGFEVKANLFNLANGQKVVLELESTNLKQTLMLRRTMKREREVREKQPKIKTSNP